MFDYFSDVSLDMFTRSESLPFPMGYFHWRKRGIRANPILEVLADQMWHDPGTTKIYGASTLLYDMLNALENKKVRWPKDIVKMSSLEWLKKMKTDPIFYFHHIPYKMQDFENVIFQLASNFLQKTIELVPVLEQGQHLTFEPFYKVKPVKKYYIACCNKITRKNFFISIFPKE